MEIGIGLAVLVAVATNLASLLKHRGCQDTASVSGSKKLAGLRDLAELALVRRRLGARRGRLARPRRRPLARPDLARPGDPRRRRGHPGGALAALLRPTGRAAPVGGAGDRRDRPGPPRRHPAALPGSDSSFSLAGILSFEGGLDPARRGDRPRPPVRATLGPPAQRPPRGPRRPPLRPRGHRDQGGPRRRRQRRPDRPRSVARRHRLRRARPVHGGRPPSSPAGRSRRSA